MRRLIAVALACGLFAGAAHADKVHRGAGVSCQTVAQIKQALDLAESQKAEAIVSQINEKEGGEVCHYVMTRFQFLFGSSYYETPTTVYQIRRVKVMGMEVLPGTWLWYPDEPERFIAIGVRHKPGKDI